ncbi:unnamed protein product [Thlaspi arvense]|uniref:Uncharacterized protein n=1 Tax=Thlaspi arvense TaxID=13288 RepID=A0AAU9RWN1_THLAR|nr:unnamed protein product [Thlaspi arvense]
MIKDVSKALTRAYKTCNLIISIYTLFNGHFGQNLETQGWFPENMAPCALKKHGLQWKDCLLLGQARAIGRGVPSCLAATCPSQSLNSTGVHLSACAPLGSPGSWVKGEVLQEPTLVKVAQKT